MAWLVLVAAGLFEIGWAVGLKAANGRPLILALTVISMIASVALLYVAMRDLPLGTAYAVWTGIGAAGTVILGMIAYNEDAAPARIMLLAVLIGSIIGLRYVSAH